MKLLLLSILTLYSFSSMAMPKKCPNKFGINFLKFKTLHAKLILVSENSAQCNYEGTSTDNNKVIAELYFSSNRYERNKGLLYVTFINQKILSVSDVVLHFGKRISFDSIENRGTPLEKLTRIYNLSTNELVVRTNNHSIY